ncbi:hypothetical protein [Nonomuraea sp. PA05]|nr:hypothetical protein [Nonomuraea sp. PA05]
MVINTGIYCSNGGSISLSGVAIGDGATVILGVDETQTDTDVTVTVTDQE